MFDDFFLLSILKILDKGINCDKEIKIEPERRKLSALEKDVKKGDSLCLAIVNQISQELEQQELP